MSLSLVYPYKSIVYGLFILLSIKFARKQTLHKRSMPATCNLCNVLMVLNLRDNVMQCCFLLNTEVSLTLSSLFKLNTL